MSRAVSDIHVCIVSWPEHHDAARAIAAAVLPSAGAVSTVYSTADGSAEDGPGRWVPLPDSAWFGPKFRALLEQVLPGQTMLLVQADADCDDWPGLLRHCADAMSSDVGLWSPTIDGTPYPNNRVATGHSPRPDLIEVLQTDAIVLALAPAVRPPLAELDFACNNLGWGIDWAAIAIARRLGLSVLRDLRACITHPPSRGYGDEAAGAQMWAFLRQLPEAERARYFADERRLRWRMAAQERMDFLSSISRAEAGAALEPLRATLHTLCLAGGRLSLAQRPGSPPPVLSLAGQALPMQRRDGPPPICRVLPLCSVPQAGPSVSSAQGDWSCPGVETLTMVFAPEDAGSTLPLVDTVIPRRDGPQRLCIGLAAHRADADLVMRWSDREDRDRSETQTVKIAPGFAGTRAGGDFQGVQFVIPQIGADRVLHLSLRYWGRRGSAEGPPVVLMTRPVLLSGPAGNPALSPLLVVGRDVGAPPAEFWEADLGSMDAVPMLHLGGEALTLPVSPAGAELILSQGRLHARAAMPGPAVLVIGGRMSRQLWLGPEPLALDLAPGLLGASGKLIELRDASGSLSLARYRGTT